MNEYAMFNLHRLLLTVFHSLPELDTAMNEWSIQVIDLFVCLSVWLVNQPAFALAVHQGQTPQFEEQQHAEFIFII